MHVHAFTLIILAALACSPSVAAAQHTVQSNGERHSLDCNGQDVKVAGSKNELTLRGDCPRVDVTGGANVITIEAVDRIELTGTQNRVTWQRGVSREKPRVSSTGLNTVERAATSGDAVSTSGHKPPSRSTRSQPPVSGTPREPHTGQEAPAKTAGDEISLLADGRTYTIDCRNLNVFVAGSRNRVTLTGQCPEVRITGDRNTIDIEAAGRISIPGSGNEVSWIRATTGAEPRTSVTGERNRISRKR